MDVGELIKEPLAQLGAAVVSLAAGWRVWRNQSSSDAKARADDGGQIAALATWKELLEGERTARKEAEDRADKFAAERNEALQQTWELKGQMSVMTETMGRQADELGRLRDTLTLQSTELVQLRDQVRQLKEQINAAT